MSQSFIVHLLMSDLSIVKMTNLIIFMSTSLDIIMNYSCYGPFPNPMHLKEIEAKIKRFSIIFFVWIKAINNSVKSRKTEQSALFTNILTVYVPPSVVSVPANNDSAVLYNAHHQNNPAVVVL